MSNLPLSAIQTPAHVLDIAALKRNLATAERIREQAGCKVILALKGFAQFSAFPYMRDYLDGTTASGIYEARLGAEEFGKEVHVYSPAFDDAEIEALLPVAGHITFNSVAQFERYYPVIKKSGKKISCGLRINPELSQVGVALYNPCAPCSRLGVRKVQLTCHPERSEGSHAIAGDPSPLAQDDKLEGLEGLHFHVLCENMAEASVALIEKVDREWGDFIREHTIKWVNFGGGHYINHADYKVEKLIAAIKKFREKYKVEVILEPGGALAYRAGYLVASVLDIVENGKQIAILDTSATTHMPDVLEMPYRPEIIGAGQAGEKAHSYQLGGRTCLAGDVIGEYSFDKPLAVGDKLVFTDMAQYAMVKGSTFNGMPLPDIGILHEDGNYELVKRFGYQDFRGRLS